MTKGRISPSRTASRRSSGGKRARHGNITPLTPSGTDQVGPARTDPPQHSPSGRKHRCGMNPLRPDEVLAVLKEARAHSARNWAMVLLAYRHGLRASEVCELRLADIDLKAESISIRRLKGSLHTVQPLYQHKGQPLLDEGRALRCWLRERGADGSSGPHRNCAGKDRHPARGLGDCALRWRALNSTSQVEARDASSVQPNHKM
jgi:Phage integrase family